MTTTYSKIKGFKFLGKQQTYDLEVNHKDHQFYLANGLLSSNSHAVAYSNITYMCAHLLTYYPNEWVATYIDYCSTDKGKGKGEDPKTIAFGEANALGYKVGKPDLNLSQRDTVIDKHKVIIPSFNSLKGIGAAAQYEIMKYRPYKSIDDMLWNENSNEWKHSKANKRVWDCLIKLEALDSISGLVGEKDCLFKNYKQLHWVLVENNEKLKKAFLKKKNRNYKEFLQELIKEANDKITDDWSIKEKMEFSKELTGTVDKNYIITPEVKEYLDKIKVRSIEDWEHENELYWAIVKSHHIGTTKNNKKFVRLSLESNDGTKHSCFIWGYNPNRDVIPPDDVLILGKFKKTDFGLSTFFGSIQTLVNK